LLASLSRAWGRLADPQSFRTLELPAPAGPAVSFYALGALLAEPAALGLASVLVLGATLALREARQGRAAAGPAPGGPVALSESAHGPDGAHFDHGHRFELRRAREALRSSEEQLRLITENVPAMIVYYDRNLVCRFANSQYAAFFGFTVFDVLGKHLSEVIGAEAFARTAVQFQRVLDGESITYEREHRDHQGRTRCIRVAFAPECDRDGVVKGSYALVTDVTAHREAEEAIRSHALRQEAIAIYGQYALETRDADKLIANAAAICTSGLDVTHSAVYRSGSGAGTGEPMQMIAGVGWAPGTQVTVASDSTTGRALVAGAPVVFGAEASMPPASAAPHLLAEGVCSGVEVVVPTSDGAFGVLAAYSKEPGRFSRDDASFLTAIATSLGTAIGRRRSEERLAYVAQFDSLTGLPNRTLFRDRLGQAMSRAERSGSPLALMLLDLDRFKEINDTLGHRAGDRLLQAVAERLTGVLRNIDTVARLGGDEFTVILEDAQGVDDVARVAEKVVGALARPFPLDGQEYYLTVSAGITLYPTHPGDIETLIMNADVAMYDAKEKGKNNFQFYRAEMNAEKQERLGLERQLRRAVARGELFMHYQPQVDLRTNRVVGAEALLRWRHPELGVIEPSRFIPIAEQSNLILQIGKWVLQTACAQNLAWQRAGMAPIRVAVNVSARQFRPELLDTVASTLAETGLSPDCLELEITEGLLIEDPVAASEVLGQLKAMGVHVAIDDFGLGYSSLSYLKHFPLDSLKIDRGFVRDLSIDPDDAAIARAIIALAHSLDLKVVAEGVETTQQLAFLRDHDCDLVQGFLYGAPVTADALAQLIARQTTESVAA
jgi:diguanylate cyclase (GGDEF)-like protein/PAS domain S-box-containing protein